MEYEKAINALSTQMSLSVEELSIFSAQYSALREEVLKRIEIQHQLVSLTLIVAGTFLTLGIQESILASVMLVYPIFAMFLSAGWAHNEIRIAQIGRYLKDSVEQQIMSRSMGWESYYEEKKLVSTFSLVGSLNIFSSRGVFLGTQILTLPLALWRLNYSVDEIILLVFDTIAFGITLLFLRDWRKVTHKKN